jgi:hypothetical protein
VADVADAAALVDALCAAGATARACELERDYGMFSRVEAPQYYLPMVRFEANEEKLSAKGS